MIIKLVLVVSIFVTVLNSQSCISKLSQIILNPSTEETRLWGLRDTFFSGQNLSFSLSHSRNYRDFYIQDPIFATDAPGSYKVIKPKILFAVPLMQKYNQAWMNSFVSLAQIQNLSTTITLVLWADGNLQQSRSSPKFNLENYIQSPQPPNKVTHLGILYIDESNVLVDCFDPKNNKNWYILVNKKLKFEQQNYEVDNTKDYKNLIKRVTHLLHQDKSEVNQTTYLLRGVPEATLEPKFKGKSIIEVFELDADNKPVLTKNLLDAATLAKIQNDTSKQPTFGLIDFKIGLYSIYILDSSSKLYRVQYQASGQWIYRGRIQNNDETALAFDINVPSDTDISRVAILYSDNFVVYSWPRYSQNFTNKTIYQLNFTINGTISTFKFSKSYIQIQEFDQNKLYTYDLSSNQIFEKINLGEPAIVLVNPQQDLSITLTSSKTQTYSFTQGLLRLKAPRTEHASKSITLTATAPDSIQCNVTILYSVYNRTDWNIYTVDPLIKSLPSMVTYPSLSQYPLQRQVTGPNLNYEFDLQKVFQIQQLCELKVQNKIYPKANEIIFTDIVTSDNPNVYTQAIQTKNLTLTIWQCTVSEKIQNQTSCEILGQINTTQRLSDDQFYQFAFFDQIVVVYQNTNFSISLNSCDENQCKQYGQIQYLEEEGNEITSFVVQSQYIWVVREKLATIDIFSAYGDNELIESITQDDITKQGFTFSFIPSQIFANKLLNSNLVFVDNQYALFIFTYPQQLNLIKIIPYNLLGPEIHVAVAQESFFLSELDDFNSFLSEYNFADLTNIYLQKNHNLFWYNFQRPLQARVSQKNGYLFIRALCTIKQLTYILAYAPNAQQRDSLYQAINTGVLVKENESLILSVGGNEAMYLYFNNGQLQSNMKLLKNPIVITIPRQAIRQLFEIDIISLNVKNFDFVGRNRLQCNQKVTIFNTQTDVTVSKDVFKDQIYGLKSIRNDDSKYTINLKEDWYQGQVLRFDINCLDCNKNIFFRNFVEEQKLLISYSQASGFGTLKDKLLVQTPDTIYISNKNHLSQTNVTLDQPNPEFQCSLVTASEDGSYIVSICQDSVYVYAYITQCFSGSFCFPMEYKVLEGVKQVAKIKMIGTTLFILESDWQNPLAYEGSLKIFELITENVNYKVSKNYELNSNFFRSSNDSQVFITDFDFVQVVTDNKTSNLFYLASATSGMFCVEINFFENQISSIQLLLDINLFNFLSVNQQYTYNSSLFLSVSVYKSSSSDSQISQKIFVTTNDVAHYAFNCTYNINSENYTYVNTTIDFIVNRYGYFPTINRVQVSNSTIAIPYGNAQTNQVVIAVYKIPNNLLRLSSNPLVLIIKGGIQVQLTKYQYNNFALAYYLGDETALFTNGENFFKINDSLQLIIFNGLNVKRQTLEIIARNDFSQDSFKTRISHNDLVSTSDWLWWYSLLIVFGAVLLISVGAFCIIRSKNIQQAKNFSQDSLVNSYGHVQNVNGSSEFDI